MRLRLLVLFVLAALTLSCASSARRPAASTYHGTGEASWQVDDDANIAYPRCPECGADADRKASTCGKCGASCRVVERTIPCPECDGSKKCGHCGNAHDCLACGGTSRCEICEGTGKWHGEACPECDGTKKCDACGPGHAEAACEFCSGTHVCSNCAGAGTITLR